MVVSGDPPPCELEKRDGWRTCVCLFVGGTASILEYYVSQIHISLLYYLLRLQLVFCAAEGFL